MLILFLTVDMAARGCLIMVLCVLEDALCSLSLSVRHKPCASCGLWVRRLKCAISSVCSMQSRMQKDRRTDRATGPQRRPALTVGCSCRTHLVFLAVQRPTIYDASAGSIVWLVLLLCVLLIMTPRVLKLLILNPIHCSGNGWWSESILMFVLFFLMCHGG